METRKKQQYLEGISHITKARPYSIHESRFSPQNNTALYLHWHPEIEILYLKEGAFDFYIEDSVRQMQAGDAVFIPPGLLHTAKCSCCGAFQALVFSPDFIASPMDGQYSKYVQPVLHNNASYALFLTPESGWQKQILLYINRIFEQAEQEAELAICGLTMTVWQYLYNGHISHVAGKNYDSMAGSKIQETIRYVHEHFHEDISLRQLAGTAHVSEGQLCRIFKQFTGSTPFSYLKRYRILRSCAYLTQTEKKISEICTLCGFNNISYFNREFLKAIKMTPSGYRKQAGGEAGTE